MLKTRELCAANHHLTTLSALFAAALVLAACQSRAPERRAESPATRSAATEPATQPTRGLVLVLRCDRSSVRAGDEMEISETLTNVSDHHIWENFRGYRYEFEELAYYPPNRGEPARIGGDPFIKNRLTEGMLQQPDEATGLPQYLMGFGHFAKKRLPGASETRKYQVRIFRPGIYRIRSEWDSPYSANHRDELWKEKLVSNAIEVTVFP